MQSDEQLKLIDLGAIIAMDDEDSASSSGRAATRRPRSPRPGRPSPPTSTPSGGLSPCSSWTCRRSTAASSTQLPGPETVPVFAQHESLYRAILRATDSDPERRFSSMEELADQLTGVLHEIAAADTGHPQPRISSHFSPQRAIYAAGWDVALSRARVIAALGVPRVDAERSRRRAAGDHQRHPARPTRADARACRWRREPGRSNSVEMPLRLVRASLEIGAAKDARARLAELESVIPGDWRLPGTAASARFWRTISAGPQMHFDAVLAMLPGELDAQAGDCGDRRTAGRTRRTPLRYYETVWRTDHSYSAPRSAWPAASPSGRPCRRGRRARPDPRRLSALHRGRGRRDRDPARRANRRSSGRTDTARRRHASLDADAGVRHQAGDDPAQGARRRLGLARGGQCSPRLPRSTRRRLRRSPASAPEWSRLYRELAHEATDMWERIDIGGEGERDPAEDRI